jgi:hypothetical protein
LTRECVRMVERLQTSEEIEVFFEKVELPVF